MGAKRNTLIERWQVLKFATNADGFATEKI